MRYFCSYFDSNYLVRAVPMLESLARNCGREFKVFVLCLDEVCLEALKVLRLPGVVPVALAELEAADGELLEVKPGRSRVEYYFSCTAAFMKYLLDRYPEVDLLSYLDADLYFYSSLDPVYKELGNASIMIIPHRFPSRLKHLEVNGLFNVGFVSIRRNTQGVRCLDWWRDRCLEWCFDRTEGGRFADQKYLEQFPVLFKSVCILTHVGANLAPWNIEQHNIRNVQGQVSVDGVPLIFYHFHGYRQLADRVLDLGVTPGVGLITDRTLKLIYWPYIKAVYSARKRMTSVAGSAVEQGSSRYHQAGEFGSLSRRYRFRVFLEGKVVGWWWGRPWYISPHFLAPLIRSLD